MPKKKAASMARHEAAALTPDSYEQTPAGPTGTALDANRYFDEVAVLAYKYWEERGRPEGSDQEDWFRAESELRKNAATASATDGFSSK